MKFSEHADAIELGGAWHISDGLGEYDFSMLLPGDVITGLRDAGLIDDPYWARNEYGLRWISERDWILSKTFRLDSKETILVLGEIDTVATIFLNGEVVLQTQNAHRTYRVDLADHATVGDNTLEIRLHAVTKEANQRQAAQPFFIPYHAENSPIANGNMLRKPQCDFGWDWNIALAPVGIAGKIRLEPKADMRINRLAIAQAHKDDVVTVTIDAHLEGRGKGSNALTFKFADKTLSVPVPSGADNPTVSASFEIENPRLWWPVGQGDQPLYDLIVSLDGQSEHRRIGLRTIELVSEPDEAGRSFYFKVNGRPVFSKGANWIPADALFGRIEPDRVEDLLQSAVDANMNMIRVWGGGRYEPNWFHDACDRLGLLVWQDFMFACNLYPSTPAFVTEVEAEVREVVARLHHHASTALWVGDNELVGALNWFEESRKDRDCYLVNYDRLNRAIEHQLLKTDPTAIWWPSSPTPGPMNFGDAWHADGSGDMHFWSVWHEGRDFEHYRDVSPRFCSEFGFQSYPSMNVIRTFAGPEDFNISAPVFESHQKNAGGNARIAETMFRYFRFPNNFENFVYLSQIQQGLAIKTAVSHWRSLKPHCMGTLIWQLNDTWPVCSWSSLDYGGGWKLLHHMAKKFYAPVYVSVMPDARELVFTAVSDLPENTRVTLEISAISPRGGDRIIANETIDLSPDRSEEIARIDGVAEQEILIFRWKHEHDETWCHDHYAPQPYKTYDLQPAAILMDISEVNDGFKVRLRCEKPAFFVALEANVAGRFSDNAFTMLPGEPVEVFFKPLEPVSSVIISVKDLHAATCA
ncbi:beta-mannosidase [Cohaesibacter sp. ES.047]|uniref:beta-mannosidase n=1 Tax=Cohaesibacter sp. ES.047 TaxID=1798205 RepID=UPI000BB8F85E|nr:glycoside hydrolase family 2 protein [Cohaesibacter sp. ES.047]SNY93229.1 beta-mannosidase [Cohaesibacter sp. ES.047]